MLASPLSRPADVAIDLGTSNTRVFVRGRGLVVDEPSVVASQDGPRGRQIVAVGQEAKRMLGRTPKGMRVIRPLQGGVVADFEATEHLLRALLKRAGTRSLLRPRLLVCIPAGTTEVERRAVQESARAAGGREVILVTTSMAGAIGADLPITDPVGSMIVDVGGGRVEVAIISLGAIVKRCSAPVGGDAMDASITAWIRDKRNLIIGEGTAETLKHRIATATPASRVAQLRIRGRNIHSGSPEELVVTSEELAKAIAAPLAEIQRVVREALQQTPPELAADVLDRGVILCGGVSCLPGLDVILRESTGLPVLQAESPTHCVARGAGAILEDLSLFERVTAAA